MWWTAFRRVSVTLLNDGFVMSHSDFLNFSGSLGERGARQVRDITQCVNIDSGGNGSVKI